MKTESVKIDALMADPANVRKHNSRNVEAIKASLQRFGQQKPVVVDSRDVVIAGNGALEAARQLGWESVEIVRTELEGADRVAYAIADNRSSELAEWDFEALGKTLEALQQEDWDLNDLGWADYEVQPLLAAEWAPPAVEEDASTATQTDHKTNAITLTADQRAVVDEAVAKVRADQDNDELADGECLVVICQQFMEDD